MKELGFIIMSNNPDIKNQLRVTNTIYYSLITGLLLFFIVVMVFIQDKDPTAGKELDNIFTFVVPIFGLMMMFISRMIYNQMILKFDSSSESSSKNFSLQNCKNCFLGDD